MARNFGVTDTQNLCAIINSNETDENTEEFDNLLSSDMHNKLLGSLGSQDNNWNISRYRVFRLRETLEGNCKQQYQDYDEVFQRRKRRRIMNTCLNLTIYHKILTPLADVGYQVWRGAFLLADYLICHKDYLRGKVIIELGSGVGMLGVILSLLTHKGCYITDYTDNLLNVIHKNLDVNNHLPHLFSEPEKSSIIVRKLDWFDTKSINLRSKVSRTPPEGWISNDQTLLYQNEVVCIAADVIYDDQLTVALFETFSNILHPREHIILSLEKRFNFTLSEMSLVANGYKTFLSIINALDIVYGNTSDRDSSSSSDSNHHDGSSRYDSKEYAYRDSEGKKCIFQGKRLLLDFPQLLIDYDRTKDLELWDITFLLEEEKANEDRS